MSRSSRRPRPDPESSELQMLREELRLRLHLASKDAARQWKRIDELLAGLERELDTAGNGVRSAAVSFALEVARTFNDFLLSNLNHDGVGESPVHEAMRGRVQTCGPDDALARAAQIMWEKDVGCLPVVDADRRVLAMITDRDICMATFVQWAHLADSKVRSAMSHSLTTCSADDTLTSATQIMRENQLRRLPVVDREGCLLGIVTLGDIARYARLHSPRDAATTTDAQVNSAFAAISEPRFRSIPPPPPPDHPLRR